MKNIKINRLLMPLKSEDIVSVELHGFSNSSMSAYCSLIYIRAQTTCQTFVHLVSGKTKVAPISKCTIPRLELLGCVLLCKLMLSVKKVVVCSRYNKHIFLVG